MEDIILKYMNDEISLKEVASLVNEGDFSEDEKQQFQKAISLKALTGFTPQKHDMAVGLSSLKKFNKSQSILTISKDENNNPFSMLWKYAAVASIAILITLGCIKLIGENSQQETFVYNEITVPCGQRARIVLEDSTVVWINSNTTLRYPSRFTNQERRVTLSGEAYFEVKKNAEKPFVVSTKHLDIKVLGTVFNVYAYDKTDKFVTTLLNGSVRVYNPLQKSQEILLKPQEEVEWINGNFIKTSIKDEDHLLWKDGLYAFDDISYIDIMKQLSVYYDVKIDVHNHNFDQYRFSGKFRQIDGVESVLRILQKVHNFSYTKDEEQQIITIY